MNAEWPIVRLGDYCLKVGSGATPRGGSNVYLDKGSASLIRSQNIYNHGFKEDGLVFIDDTAANKLKNVIVEANDVLLNITGDSVARACLVPKKHLPARVNQHVAIIRPDPDKFDSRFIHYYLVSPSMQSYLLTLAGSGGTRNALTKGMIENFDVPKPDKYKQKQIADILSSLDDKIHLNRQINQTLEQIAQAIFKSWFVDFEPVKAKIAAKENGQDPKRAAMCAISGKSDAELNHLPADQLSQLATTAALFPDELVKSELGLIPKGWRFGSMKDCCVQVESGGTPKRSENSYWNGNVLWLSSGEVRDVIVLDTKEKITKTGLNNSSAKLWPYGSTVVAMYGATAGQVCLLAKEMTANQACCALIPKNYCQSYIFLSARRSIEDLSGKASGSAQQNLNKSLVSDHKVLLPSEKALESFEQFTASFLEGWIKNTEQSIVLAQLRDTLLPKLLSGEISVADTQAKIEAAV